LSKNRNPQYYEVVSARELCDQQEIWERRGGGLSRKAGASRPRIRPQGKPVADIRGPSSSATDTTAPDHLTKLLARRVASSNNERHNRNHIRSR